MQNLQEALNYVYENIKNNADNKLFQDKEYLRAIIEQMVMAEIPEVLTLEELKKIDMLMSQKNFKESDFIANIPQYPQILDNVVKNLIIDYITWPEEDL